METQNPHKKFQKNLPKIQELCSNSERFHRIFSEYDTMTDELWDLENAESLDIPDDFLDSVKLQATYLEDEIEDWLLQED